MQQEKNNPVSKISVETKVEIMQQHVEPAYKKDV